MGFIVSIPCTFSLQQLFRPPHTTRINKCKICLLCKFFSLETVNSKPLHIPCDTIFLCMKFNYVIDIQIDN